MQEQKRRNNNRLHKMSGFSNDLIGNLYCKNLNKDKIECVLNKLFSKLNLAIRMLKNDL